MKEEKNDLTNEQIDQIGNDDFDVKELKEGSKVDLEEIDKNLSGSTRWYYRKNGTVYRICRDSDGIVISYPGGSTTYGTGYSVSDVKSRHGLSNYSPYRSARSNSNC